MNDNRYGEMMIKAMNDAGKSRSYMARQMGVAPKTVYNWEVANYYPTVKQMDEWFDILHMDQQAYKNEVFRIDEKGNDNKQITKDLHNAIDSYTPRRRSLLHFILCGKHGADIDTILNLFVAYLQTLWKDRIVQSALALSNYRLNKEKKNYDVVPNCDLISKSILACSESYINGQEGYKIK